jgi:adenylate cyclase
MHRCAVVWSDQIELEMSSISGLQKWVEQAAEAIGVAVRQACREGDDADKLQSRIARARAFAVSLEPAANRTALRLLNEILAASADEPNALALAAWCYAQRVVYNWSSNSDGDRTEAKYHAALATRVGIDDAKCLTTIATARMLIGDPNGAEVLIKRSLQLNARASETRIRSGWLANYGEDPREAARHFQAAIKLAPVDPAVFNALAGLGVAHFIAGDYAQAIGRMEQALALNPRAIWIYRNLVPAYTAAGERQKAEDGVRALVENYPDLTVERVTSAIIFSAPVMAKFAKGLREAGLPR